MLTPLRGVLVAACVALLLPSSSAVAEEGPTLFGRVGVRKDGFARLEAKALRELGAASALHVEIRRGGSEVATFETADGDLVFLAWENATPHSAFGVYELWMHEAPLSRQRHLFGSMGDDTTVPRPLHRRHRLDQDVVFGELAGGRAAVYAPDGRVPTWFLGSIHPGRSFVLDLDPAGAAKGEAQTLDVEVWGTHVGEIALRARWGDTDLGVARAKTAAGGVTLRWEVAPDAVPPEGTALVLQDVSPPPPPPPKQDVSHGRGTIWIDAITLWGLATHRVGSRPMRFDPLNAPGILEADAGLWAAVVNEHGSSAPLGTGPRVPFARIDANERIVAASAAPVHQPYAAKAPPHPLKTAGKAAHVVLAVPALLEPAGKLARHRVVTGTASVVVPVLDVYAAYGHGERNPQAIRAFVLDLMGRADAPLEFLVLAGDATLNRTDMVTFATIPTPMARTMYNGATSADRLYAAPRRGKQVGGPSLGRVPFRDAKAMHAWVDRLIAYETKAPPHPTRRLMRFVTSEGRFGAFIDRLLERMFQVVVTNDVPPAYDIAVTFASMRSAYLWPPPELNDKVIQGFNDGCLFLTYVGHGFAEGFDSLRVGAQRFPILAIQDVPKIRCEGTPPAVMVLACTTAIFDLPSRAGIGETLLANPYGPIAYWGATRICHPAANTLLGRSLAQKLAQEQGRWRLGQILDRGRDAVLQPGEADASLSLIRTAIPFLAAGASSERLALEGAWMYTLLGDPATKMAFPRNDLDVRTIWTSEDRLEASVTGEVPAGTALHVSVEVPRDRRAQEPEPVENPADPASFPTVRRNHGRVNDLRLVHQTVEMGKGGARVVFEIETGVDTKGLIVKAWAITDQDVHQGATVLGPR